MFCKDCFMCWKRVRRFGPQLAYKEVYWMCLKRPGYPIVYKALYAYGRLKKEVKVQDFECPLFEPHPWKVSEKFKKWLEQGVDFGEVSFLWRQG